MAIILSTKKFLFSEVVRSRQTGQPAAGDSFVHWATQYWQNVCMQFKEVAYNRQEKYGSIFCGADSEVMTYKNHEL